LSRNELQRDDHGATRIASAVRCSRLAGDEGAAQAAFAEAFAFWVRKGSKAAARTLRETIA